MGLLGTIWRVWEVGQDATDAVQAARVVLEAGGSPMAALEAFSAQTDTGLDDAAVAELRTVLVQVVAALEIGVRVALALSTALADPRVARALTAGVRVAGDAGYRLIGWRATLARWMQTA